MKKLPLPSMAVIFAFVLVPFAAPTFRLIGARGHVHANAFSQPSPSPQDPFEATVANTTPAPKGKPAGMAWIPGGEFSMGAKDPRMTPEGGREAMEDARPIHRVHLDGFWMDKTDVTNKQFAAFVRATGYVTVAERKPRPEDFRGPESSFDPAELGTQKRVERGGSFLCTAQYCSRYLVGTRGKGEVSSATNHLGFRCVADHPVETNSLARNAPPN